MDIFAAVPWLASPWAVPGILAACFALFFLLSPLIVAWRQRASPQYAVETYFEDPGEGGARKLFPSLFDQPSRYITLVVPAYNEELRLPSMMDETLRYLAQRQQQDARFTWEIIIVDDGSSDQTVRVAHDYSARCGADAVRVLRLARNHGKGGAVRKGALRARGHTKKKSAASSSAARGQLLGR